jgi:DNA transformation protein
MATKKTTAEFILEQLGRQDRFSVRSMFGEFALYADGKPVAFICDDQLFVKIMDETTVLENRCERAPAYPGSKDYHLVPEDVIIADRKLPDILLKAGAALPLPTRKRR